MITPQHDFTKSPPQLFYMDQNALQHLANSNEHAVVVSAENPILLQQVNTSGSKAFPVQPPLSTVGEFKVTPMIHAGYGVTWFALSGAGVYMTRKLITRGRM